MSYPVRVVLTTCFYMIMGLVVLNRSRQVVNEKILFFLMALVIAIFGVWGSIRLNMLDLAINAVVFNLPVLAVLLSGLVYFIKHSLIKVYLLMVIGHYLFEYPYQLGLW